MDAALDLKAQFAEVQVKDFSRSYLQNTELIKSLQKTMEHLKHSGILDDSEFEEYSTKLLIKKHTLYETMNNLTTNQLEQIHRESVCNSIFDPTMNTAEPNKLNHVSSV